MASRAAILLAAATAAEAFSPSAQFGSIGLRGTPKASAAAVSKAARQAPMGLRMAAINVDMPALSSTMKEGKIVQWTVKEGDKVSAGDVIMVVESDKADMDVEAFEDGYMAKIMTPEGESAIVGSTVAVIAETQDEISTVAASAGSAPAPAAAADAPAAAAAGGAPYDGPSISMPALSSTMKEGKIVQWTVKEGDKVSAGDVVMVVESDKADMDVEAFEDGYIAKIVVGEGDVAAVGLPVAYLAESEADIATVAAAAAAAPAAAAPAPAAAAAAPAAPAPAAPAPAAPAAAAAPASGSGFKLPGGVVSATPAAKKAAKKNGIDIATVAGTGLGGRVTEDDVLSAAGKPAASASSAPAASSGAFMREAPDMPDGPVKLSGMQSAVAKNMEATMESPSFQVSRAIATTEFDKLYASLKPKGVTVSALLAKAVALTLEKHPIINAGYDKATNSIVYNKNINIANAVAIDGGLITPVLSNCNVNDILSISAQWKDLVGRAKSGALRPEEYNSGTFTISNLGMFGVSSFGSLLPQGSGAILAVAGALPTVVMKNGRPEEIKKMEVTLTADHRHIYGADSALFLKDLADLLENNPSEIVL